MQNSAWEFSQRVDYFWRGKRMKKYHVLIERFPFLSVKNYQVLYDEEVILNFEVQKIKYQKNGTQQQNQLSGFLRIKNGVLKYGCIWIKSACDLNCN